MVTAYIKFLTKTELINMTLNSNNIDEQEISFTRIFNTSFREKKLISIIIFIGTLTGVIQSFLIKPTYIGNFTILIKNENKVSNGRSLGSTLSSFAGGKLIQDNENNTQRLILKSPLVLNPVFKYVKDQNNLKENKNNELNFQGWLNKHLKVDFEEESNILKVNYIDQNKEMILNTLKLISSKYQSYSKSDRIRNVNQTIKYLESQEKLMQEKSLFSKQKLNKFTIENGLGNVDGFVELGTSNNPLLNSMSGENVSIADLEESLKMYKATAGGSSTLDQRYSSQFALLERYESNYIDLASKLKANSKTLKTLKNKINNLKSFLKRPNEILIQFQDYKNEAQRDAIILGSISQRLEILRLEKIKTPDPWLLISEPVVQKSKIAPQKSKRAMIAFIISFIIGIFAAIIKEKIQNYVYEMEDFQKIIEFKYIDTIYNEKYLLSSDLLKKLFSAYDTKKTKNYIIAKDSFKDNKIFKNLKEKIEVNHLSIDKINSIDSESNIIIVFESGAFKFNQLYLLNKYNSIYKYNFIGWIYNDKKLKFD